MSRFPIYMVVEFWRRVTKTDTCWIYPKAPSLPYPRVSERGKHGKKYYAHRFAYELTHGPIAADLVIDHLCRNVTCVNPAHLQAVSRAENAARGLACSRPGGLRTHCRHGHELIEANVEVVSVKGRLHPVRRCRRCVEDRYAEMMRRRAAGDTAKRKMGRPVSTHCSRGHEFTAETTLVEKHGRTCKVCKKAMAKLWRAKQRQAPASL